MPANKCSHIVYSFVLPASGGDIQDFTDAQTLQSLVSLKNSNPNLKVMVAIGGWNAGSTTFSEVSDNWGTARVMVFIQRTYGLFTDRKQ